ncbi:hypothetical protein DPMN_098505 [Dreissena polymorpha]|uniref:Uncharacterized protein n=1 Tax=Dreissena polymorpha TaxID=45954 RepID=A0A9D4R7C0_DREPO|nr:hypothetical protein DPMN_098505 [Dreissena polymorpha]
MWTAMDLSPPATKPKSMTNLAAMTLLMKIHADANMVSKGMDAYWIKTNVALAIDLAAQLDYVTIP